MPQAKGECQEHDWFAVKPAQPLVEEAEKHVLKTKHTIRIDFPPPATHIEIRYVEKRFDGPHGPQTFTATEVFDWRGNLVVEPELPSGELAGELAVAEVKYGESPVLPPSPRLKCPDCGYQVRDERPNFIKTALENHRRIKHAPRISLKCPDPDCEVWILRMNEVVARQKMRRHLNEIHDLDWDNAESLARGLKPTEPEAIPVGEGGDEKAAAEWARAKARKREDFADDEDDGYLEELIEYNVSLLATPPTKCSACGGLLEAKGEACPATLINDILYVTCGVGCYGYILDFLQEMGVEVR